MKQSLFLLVLALGMFSINGSAQMKKPVRKTTIQTKPKANPIPKDSREYQVEEDGFEWYKVCKNGKWGAEDKNGSILIPAEYKYIRCFLGDDYRSPYFIVSTLDSFSGIYNQNGRCIIPITRKYTMILKEYDYHGRFGTHFRCYKNDGFSLCDANGREVASISGAYKFVSPEYESGKMYYIVQTKDGRYGIVDGNGKTIVEPKYTDMVTSFTDNNFTTKDSSGNRIIVGYLSSITTVSNPLANNPKESSYFSNSTASSNIGSNSNNNSGGSTTTVVVEHHRDQVPVQEWQQCPACYGSGQCPYVKCGGSGWYYIGDRASTCSMCHGSGKCSTCAGKGGHYITVYR